MSGCLATTHQKFIAAGRKANIAMPGSVTPTADPLSFALAYNHNDQGTVDAQQTYLEQLEEVLRKPISLAHIGPAVYKAASSE